MDNFTGGNKDGIKDGSIDLTIVHTDCMAWLRERAASSVHCIVTSPPFWGLRDYDSVPTVWGGDADCPHAWASGTPAGAGDRGKVGDRGKNARMLVDERDKGATATCGRCGAGRSALGLEPTPDLYIQHLTAIFRECHRVLAADGTLWLNLGDSYARSPAKGGSGTYNGRNGYGEGYAGSCRPIPLGLKAKDLIGIPWRVALALQADGWFLRSDVIWEKPDVLPESVKDRPTKSHEYLFLLTKAPRYYYDPDAVREPGTDGAPRNRRTIWRLPKARLNAQEFGIAHVRHFAMFPPELALPCVLAGCPPGGVVLDPFSGSASTGVACLRAGDTKNVSYIGLEINPEYAQLGEARLAFEFQKIAAAKSRAAGATDLS